MAATVYCNKYEIQEEIAQGGMGIVYKAWDRMLERVVALKVIHQNLANDSNFLARFLDEARKMALLHHSNIIQIYSVEKDQGITFLVMEYFPGPNLKTYLCQSEPLGLKESVNIVSQIAHALSFTHRQGIIHRDIKPANILLNNSDNSLMVKLTDFGIARALDQTSHTITGQLLGTVKYMSPEQAGDIPLDGRSDLYSLGMLFFELVTGTNPRNDLTAVGILSMLITKDHIPSLHFPENLNIPHEIQQTIFDLLQFHPTDRIPNAETLIERLEKSYPNCCTPTPTVEAENTDKTITLNLAHSRKSLANEPTASNSSKSFPLSTSQRQPIHEVPTVEHRDSSTSLQNSSTIQSEPIPKSEPLPQVFSWPRNRLFVATIFLVLIIGGYAWNDWSSQPALQMDNRVATKSNIENLKAEKSTSTPNPTIQPNIEVRSKEPDAPTQKSTTSSPSEKPQLAKILVAPREVTLPIQKPTEDKISPRPIVPEAAPITSHVPIPPLAPSSDLTPIEAPPITSTKLVPSIEKNELSTDTIYANTSQEFMRSAIHSQVEQLQQAIMGKDWEAIERISSMSESRRSWLETLFMKYQSVQIDIAEIAAEGEEGQAIIYFTKGIRSNGEIAIPNNIGRTIKITIPKNGDQWGRIIW